MQDSGADIARAYENLNELRQDMHVRDTMIADLAQKVDTLKYVLHGWTRRVSAYPVMARSGCASRLIANA